MTTDLALRKTLTSLITHYEAACTDIEAAYASLAATEAALQIDFGPYIKVLPGHSYADVGKTANAVIKEITAKAWYTILERMELRKIASLKRYEAVMADVDAGRMPVLNQRTVLDLLQAYSQNMSDIAREAAQEVYDILTPGKRSSGQRFKTNARYGIGKTVILPGYVEHAGTSTLRVNYYRRTALVQVDRVFHLLDGQAVLDGYTSPLCDAINSAGTIGATSGQTAYFAWKACHNSNLHLRFLRPDLVAALNAAAADGRSLKP